MNMPMTGITKNPMKPSSAPTSSVRLGTPAVLSCRPGTRYFTTDPPTRSRALTANTAQAVVVPTSRVHTKMAPSTRTVPGRTGTMMPAMPTAIAMEMRISVGLTGHSLPDVVRVGGQGRAGRRTAPESVSGAVLEVGGCGRCGSGLAARGGVQLVGLVVDGSSDLTELLAVLAGVVSAEEQLAAGLELHTEVGLGAAAVAAVTGREDGLGGCGGSGHVSLISVHRCLAQRSQWGKDSLLSFQLRELVKSITSHSCAPGLPSTVDELLRKRYLSGAPR